MTGNDRLRTYVIFSLPLWERYEGLAASLPSRS
jgi:hypothetical protein